MSLTANTTALRSRRKMNAKREKKKLGAGVCWVACLEARTRLGQAARRQSWRSWRSWQSWQPAKVPSACPVLGHAVIHKYTVASRSSLLSRENGEKKKRGPQNGGCGGPSDEASGNLEVSSQRGKRMATSITREVSCNIDRCRKKTQEKTLSWWKLQRAECCVEVRVCLQRRKYACVSRTAHRKC